MDILDWVLLMAIFQVYEDSTVDEDSKKKARELKRKFNDNEYVIEEKGFIK